MKQTVIHVRPKRKLSDILFLGMSLVVILSGIILLMYGLYDLPDAIPMHFNNYGKSNGWNSKWLVLILPAIGFIVMYALEYIKQHPWFVTGWRVITKKNSQHQFSLVVRLMSYFEFIFSILFLVTAYDTLAVAICGMSLFNGMGYAMLGAWVVIPCAVGFLLSILLYFVASLLARD